MTNTSSPWEWEISNKTSFMPETLRELWSYRHFVSNLVRREFLLNYQQTVIGPLWILFQPILTLVTYVLVFGKMVKLSTGSLPPVIFYFSGIILWNLFSEVFGNTSNTFKSYFHIFSKVYFPRIIIPIATLLTHSCRFLIQLGLLFVLTAYYVIFENLKITFSYWMLALPVAIICIAMIGFAAGLMVSVLTAKYRDIGNLVGVGIRLLMFVTPVLYPLASVDASLLWIVQCNPLTSMFELFRYALYSEGAFMSRHLIYSLVFMMTATIVGIAFFNKKGDKLLDVV